MTAQASISKEKLALYLCILVVAFGSFLRIARWEVFDRLGFDESYYVTYTVWHQNNSLLEMPGLVSQFIEKQKREANGLPPPLRLFYPYSASVVADILGVEPVIALLIAGTLASCLVLLVSSVLSWRMFGSSAAVGITSLVAVSLNQIHQAQRIMVDSILGILTILGLWAIWEIGQDKSRKWWLLFLVSAFCIVLVKEGAFFVYVGFVATLLFGRRLGYLKAHEGQMLIALVLVGATAFLTLCGLSGGMDTFFYLYTVLVEKSLVTPYVISTGDGPWYRYIVDSTMAQPLITILAIAGILQLPKENKPLRFLCVFLVATFAIMCQIKNGQYFRYTLMWDFPLRALAFLMLSYLCRFWFPSRSNLLCAILVILVCFHEFSVYWQICVLHPSYALESIEMLQNLEMYRRFVPQ